MALIAAKKRIKKTAAGHHGGAWKIAYADFVTAMMAFFLLMWLLGSTAKGDLNGIVRARRLSHATMANIRQNLFLAFVYNAIGVPVAAGVLYPSLGLLLSPAIAAAAMALSSLSVIVNSALLKRVKLDQG